MEFAVCLNQVPDTSARIKIAANGEGIDTSGVSFVINPYDEFALEEALKLREKFGGGVTIFSIGDDSFQTNIRKGLAMGADKAVLIKSQVSDSYDVSFALTEAMRTHFGKIPDAIFLGKESTDYNNAQVGQMIAEFFDIPCVSVVVSLETDGKKATMVREVEGGKEHIETTFPLVMTAQKGLNLPRVPNMKGIMAAKTKPIEQVQIQLNSKSRLKQLTLEKPSQKQSGKIVSSALELVSLLHSEAKVV